MDNFKLEAIERRIEKTIAALKRNNMEGYYAQNIEGALEILKGMLKPGSTVSHGGSVTLKEAKVIKLLDSGKYNYIKPERPSPDGLTAEESANISRKAFFVDYYLTSSNAITENGLLYNVDGTANRVAAMMFGPKNVIVIAGYNKIVCNLEEAVNRVKSICAPANALRFGLDTSCNASSGCCPEENGCSAAERICSSYTVLAKQKIPGRIKVIFIGEELGY